MLRGPWDRDPLLPRAYSVLAVEGDRAEFLIRRVGRGSERLASAAPGEQIVVLGPLGSGFPEPGSDPVTDLLVAGGCGVAPLYMTARQALAAGRGDRTRVLFGGRESCELVLLDRLQGLGLPLLTATEDGSAGEAGLVTDLLARELAVPGAKRVLACGPEGMLRAVRELARRHSAACYLSLEAPMACGVGVCLGCAVRAKRVPYLYVCQQGPVFDAEEIWP